MKHHGMVVEISPIVSVRGDPRAVVSSLRKRDADKDDDKRDNRDKKNDDKDSKTPQSPQTATPPPALASCATQSERVRP